MWIKKTGCVLLALCMLLSLAACVRSDADSSGRPDNTDSRRHESSAEEERNDS